MLYDSLAKVWRWNIDFSAEDKWHRVCGSRFLDWLPQYSMKNRLVIYLLVSLFGSGGMYSFFSTLKLATNCLFISVCALFYTIVITVFKKQSHVSSHWCCLKKTTECFLTLVLFQKKNDSIDKKLPKMIQLIKSCRMFLDALHAGAVSQKKWFSW